MKVKPESLKIANSVASIKECGGNTARKNYWNAVHLLETRGRNLVLRTNDGSIWIEWNIPIEGEPLPLKVLVQGTAFEAGAKYVDGGSLDVTYHNRIVTLSKGQFRYPLREENPQEYTEPNQGVNPVTWVADSKPLSDSLKFISGFIDETNPIPNKAVATLYTSGILTGGQPLKIAMVKGLQASADLSFKLRTARAVSEFLSKIGDKVEISVTEATYKFRDPEAGHYLIVLAESAKFEVYVRDLTPKITEINQIDRETLLQRARVFAGAMREGVDKLNLSFKGKMQQASLRVRTPGEGDEVATDEFSIYRTVPDKPGQTETDEQKEARIPAAIDISITREFLADALASMSGTTVTFKCVGNRMALLEDERGTGEEGHAGPERSVLLTAKQVTAPVPGATSTPQVTQPVNQELAVTV